MSIACLIREARGNDFDQAMALYGELAGRDKVDTGPEGRRHWKNVLSHPGTTVYCLADGERLFPDHDRS